LVVKAYLSGRDHMDEIIKACEVMLQSGLPCFKKDAIKNLKIRFCYDKTESEAVEFIKKIIEKSYKNTFSDLYDKYQNLFEEINY
jgi:phosphatidylinositol 4-kinase